MIVATTERLILRRSRPADREPFARLSADPRVMEFMPSVLSRNESDELVDRIEADFDVRGFGLCAVEKRDDGAFLGFVGLDVPGFEAAFTPCVEIAWRISADHWGRGFATEAAEGMVTHAFETLLLDGLVSFTVPANLRSRRVMQKIGMTRDPAEDFDHPKLAPGHPLRRHVLYRLAR